MGAMHFRMRRLGNEATEMGFLVLAYGPERVMAALGTGPRPRRPPRVSARGTARAVTTSHRHTETRFHPVPTPRRTAAYDGSCQRSWRLGWVGSGQAAFPGLWTPSGIRVRSHRPRLRSLRCPRVDGEAPAGAKARMTKQSMIGLIRRRWMAERPFDGHTTDSLNRKIANPATRNDVREQARRELQIRRQLEPLT